MIDTPTVDWLALSPTIALSVAAGLALLSALLPEWMRKAVSATVALAGFVVATVLAVYVFERELDAGGAARRVDGPRPARRDGPGDPRGHRRGSRARVMGRAASHEPRRVLRAPRHRRAQGWRSS